VSREAVTYTLREGDGLEFRHDEELIHLTADEPVCKRPHAPEKQK
jgi:hypothetical protein